MPAGFVAAMVARCAPRPQDYITARHPFTIEAGAVCFDRKFVAASFWKLGARDGHGR